MCSFFRIYILRCILGCSSVVVAVSVYFRGQKRNKDLRSIESQRLKCNHYLIVYFVAGVFAGNNIEKLFHNILPSTNSLDNLLLYLLFYKSTMVFFILFWYYLFIHFYTFLAKFIEFFWCGFFCFLNYKKVAYNSLEFFFWFIVRFVVALIFILIHGLNKRFSGKFIHCLVWEI